VLASAGHGHQKLVAPNGIYIRLGASLSFLGARQKKPTF